MEKLFRDLNDNQLSDEAEVFLAVASFNEKIDEIFAPGYGCEDLYLNLSIDGTYWQVTFMGQGIMGSEEPGRQYDDDDNEIPFAVTLDREFRDHLLRIEKVRQGLFGEGT